MSRHVTMQWNLRQLMADRGLFQTSELVPLLADRDIHLSREHVYRLVTKTPQRVNLDIVAALCDALACGPGDLMTPVVVDTVARTGSDTAGAARGEERDPNSARSARSAPRCGVPTRSSDKYGSRWHRDTPAWTAVAPAPTQCCPTGGYASVAGATGTTTPDRVPAAG